MRNTSLRYTTTAISLHWVMALLIFAGFVLGLYMTGIAGFPPQKAKFYAWHKWIGVTIWLLAVIRLGWRFLVPPPLLPDTLVTWEKQVARFMHGMLYGFIFVVPTMGYLMSAAGGHAIHYFGVLPLPLLIEKNVMLKEVFGILHKWLSYAMAVMVTLHVLSALKHALIDRDGLLRRMWPWSISRISFMMVVLFLVSLSVAYAAAKPVSPKSIILVTARQFDETVVAKFQKFNYQVSFDPLHLNQFSAHVTLIIKSFKMGSKAFEQAALGPDWFNVKKFPEATFVADKGGIRFVHGNDYRVFGKLTIKGKTIHMSVPMHIKDTPTHRLFLGSLAVRRNRFGVGLNAWKGDSIVANDVNIRFRLVLPLVNA